MPIQSQRAFLTLLCLVAAASLTVRAAEPNVSGTWTGAVHIPGASTSSTTLDLEQNGEKLTGKITGTYGRQSEVTGTIVGAQIQLSYASSFIRVQTDSGVTPLVLNFTGSVSNDEIDAKAKTPLGEATLTAKRKQ